MSPTELLGAVRAAGIVLEACGDRLTYDAPKGAMTPALREELTRHKPALLALLAPVTAFVTLKNGPTLPGEVIKLACDLEARGITLETDTDHHLVVREDPRLTAADKAAIARWRRHLAAAIEYVAPEVG